MPAPRAVLALAVPALGALAADPLLSLVDTAFVGRLGPVPLAALGICTALFSFAFAIFNFLAYATTPLVASHRGRGELAESGRVVVRAVSLAVLIGAASGLVLAVGAPLWVRLMQAAPEVIDPAVDYLRVRAGAVPALLLITAGHGAYRGFQDTRTPLVVTLAVNGANALLDPLLIFGAGWGIRGAAVATLIAQWAGAVWFLLLLARRARGEGWDLSVPRPTELVPFLRVGGQLVLRTVMLVAALTISTAAAARVGTAQVAAHQVVAQVWFLLAMVVDALAIAAQAMVADLHGRGERAAARALADRLLLWGVAVGVALGAGLWAVGGVLGSWFTSDPRVVALVAAVVPIAALMQPLAALVFVADGVYMALLALRRLVASTGAGLAVTVALLALTLSLGWGLAGVWWAITGMVVARAAVLAAGYPAVLPRG